MSDNAAMRPAAIFERLAVIHLQIRRRVVCERAAALGPLAQRVAGIWHIATGSGTVDIRVRPPFSQLPVPGPKSGNAECQRIEPQLHRCKKNRLLDGSGQVGCQCQIIERVQANGTEGNNAELIC